MYTNNMNIAKGIKGIRNFINGNAQYPNWHITTREGYIAFLDWNAIDIMQMMSDNGYRFIGWTGNGLCFEEM